jgi:uncharacterized RDD family membrane protein YckC
MLDLIIAAVASSLFYILHIVSDSTTILYLGSFVAASYIFLKDVYSENGSIGKRVVGIKLTSVSSDSISTTKRIMRNIPLLIYPIEFVVIFLNRGRRIGDILSNTKVVPEEK